MRHVQFAQLRPGYNAALDPRHQRRGCLAPVLDQTRPDQALKVRALVFVEFERGRHFVIQQLFVLSWADLADLYAIAKTKRLPRQHRMLARLCWPR